MKKEVKSCVCDLKKKSNINSWYILTVGAILHFFFSIGLFLAFDWKVVFIYLFTLFIYVLFKRSDYLSDGHSNYCALRYALVKLLDLGTFITPF